MTEPNAAVRLIGRYQVLAELGRGAMGVVYRGFDPVIGRPVALKTIAFDSGNADSRALRARLYREAKAAGTLAHPNIVTIYDIVEDGDMTAVAMELVEGRPLEDTLAERGTFSLTDAVRVIEQICSALDYAGSRGIIHRDIKPANILLKPDGRAKVLDFGIARVSMSGIAQTSSIMGSPSYMSPEQVQGLPLDPRSDLFSAAVVFYELITGRRPFGGDDIATTMYRIVHEPPRTFEYPEPALGARLWEVLLVALSKTPGSRYQSGGKLVAALRAAVVDPGVGRAADASGIDKTEISASPIRETPIRDTPLHDTPIRDTSIDDTPVRDMSIHETRVDESPGHDTPIHDAPIRETPIGATDVGEPGRRPRLLVYGAVASSVMLVVVIVMMILVGRGPAATPVGPGGDGTPIPNAALAGGATRGSAPAGTAAGSKDPVAGNNQQPGTAARSADSRSQNPRPAPAGTGRAGKTAVAAGVPAPIRAAPAAPILAPPPMPKAPATGTPAAPTTLTPPPLPAATPAAPPSAASTAAESTGPAILRVAFADRPYPVTLFAGDTQVGRLDSGDATIRVEAGKLRLRAVNESVYLNADLGDVALRPGERRTLLMPGTGSAVFSVKGEDYAGVRIVIDGRPVPGPYPAQIAQIAEGGHQVIYRWTAGALSGREVTGTVNISGGGHFIIRAAVDNAQILVQKFR
jgi:serine/threonine protein kinase